MTGTRDESRVAGGLRRLRPAGQAPVLADLPHPLLGARRASAVVTMSSWSPRRSGVSGEGTKPWSSRTTSVTFAPGRQPQLEHLDPVQLGPRPDLHLQQVGAHLLQRRRLHLDVDGDRGLGQAAAAGRPTAASAPARA